MNRGDKIKLGKHEYMVDQNGGVGYFLLNVSGAYNYTIFSELKLNKESFTRSVLGYCGAGVFPYCKTLQDLEKLVDALRAKITPKHPKDWYIEVTKENQAIVSKWRLSVATNYLHKETIDVGLFIMSSHSDGSYYYGNYSEKGIKSDFPTFQQIDFETFLQITGMKNSKQTHTVTREQFIEGYNLACSEWKTKLQDQFAKTFAIQDTAEVSDELVSQLRRAASNAKQESFLHKCFGSSDMISSRDLKIGEAMRIVDSESSYNGVIILRAFDRLVDINDPRSTWENERPNFYGVKVKIETKVIED